MAKIIKKIMIIVLILVVLIYLLSIIAKISSHIVYNIEKSYDFIKTKISNIDIIKNNSIAG